MELTEKEQEVTKGLHLLTMKPMFYILNVKSGTINVRSEDGDRWRELKGYLEDQGASWVEVDAGVEGELGDVHPDEKSDFRRELGLESDGLDALIKKGYETLDLISYFTTGPKEARAWTIRRGFTAPQAAGVIHSDFRDKFIRAETIQWDALIKAGGWGRAREQGLVRSEGKEYVVTDGDVMEFRHS